MDVNDERVDVSSEQLDDIICYLSCASWHNDDRTTIEDNRDEGDEEDREEGEDGGGKRRIEDEEDEGNEGDEGDKS